MSKETWTIPEQSENIWQFPSAPLSNQQKDYSKEMLSNAFESDINIPETEEQLDQLNSQSLELIKEKRRSELDDYMVTTIGLGVVNPEEAKQIYQDTMDKYVNFASIEEEAFLNSPIDEFLVDSYSKTAIDQKHTYQSIKDYEDMNIAQQAAGGVLGLWQPAQTFNRNSILRKAQEKMQKNWMFKDIAPNVQDRSWTAMGWKDNLRKYIAQVKENSANAGVYDAFLTNFINELRKAGANKGDVHEMLTAFSQPITKFDRGLTNFFDAFDYLMPVTAGVGTVTKGLIKGATEGLAKKALTHSLEWTFPLTSLATLGTYNIAKGVAKKITFPSIKSSRSVVLSEADKLKQAGDYEGAAKARLAEGDSRATLHDVAEPTRTTTNTLEGSNIATTNTLKHHTALADIILKHKLSGGPATAITESTQEYFEKEYLRRFAQYSNFDSSSASLISVNPDGSGGWVRLLNNGKYFDTMEQALQALEKWRGLESNVEEIAHAQGELFSFLKSDLKGAKADEARKSLGIMDRNASPVLVEEAKAPITDLDKNGQIVVIEEGTKPKWAIHVPLYTGNSMLDWNIPSLKSFKTYEEAYDLLKKHKDLDKADIVKRGDNDYVIKPRPGKALKTAETGAPTVFSKNLFSTIMSSIGTKGSWRALALATVQTEGKVEELVTAFAKKHFKGLSKAEKAELESLVDYSREQQMFYDPEILDRKGCSKKVQEAYQSLRELSDTVWEITGIHYTDNLRKLGYKSISLQNNIMGIGRRLDMNFVKHPEDYQWGVYDGSLHPSDGTPRWFEFYDPTSVEFSTRFPVKDYEFLRFDVPYKGKKNWIIKRDLLKYKELPANVQRYLPGFQKKYPKNSRFVKMVIPVINSENKIVDLDHIITVAASKDPLKAAQFTEELNKALEVVVNKTGELTGRFSGQTIKEMEELFQDMGVPLENAKGLKFEAVKDGERPLSLNKFNVESATTLDDLRDVFSTSERGLMETETNLMARHRDLGILDIDGGKFAAMNANDLMLNMIDNIVHTVGIKEYRRIAGEDFVQTFKHLLDPAEVQRMTPYELLLYGNLRQGEDFLAAQSAQAQARVMAGIPTKLDEWINKMWNAFKDEILYKYFPKLGKFDNILSDLPVKTITGARTLAFQWLLGMLNPAPFFQNVLSTSIAISISPEAGLKALPYTLRLIGLAGRTVDESVLKSLSPEVREILENINELPIHQQSLKYSGYANDISLRWQGLSKFLTIPFEVGERFVRVHAAITAFLEAKAKNPMISFKNMKYNDKAFYLDRMDTLYNRMSRASVAPIQRGVIGSIGLQMLGYQMRIMDQLFSGKLTKLEKGRLIGTAMFLTGMEGVLGKELYSNIYSAFYSDSDEGPNEYFEAVSGGLGHMFAEWSGTNLDITAPIDLQLGDFPTALTHLINPGMSPLGTKLQGIPGIIVTGVNLTLKSLFGEGDFANAASMIPEIMYDLAKEEQLLPSSLTKLSRAFVIWQTGQLRALSGSALVNDLSGPDAIGYFLGAGLEGNQKRSLYQGILKDKNDKIRAAAAIVTKYYEQFAADPSDENYQKFQGAYDLCTVGFNDIDKLSIIRGATTLAKISEDDLKVKMIKHNIGVAQRSYTNE